MTIFIGGLRSASGVSCAFTRAPAGFAGREPRCARSGGNHPIMNVSSKNTHFHPRTPALPTSITPLFFCPRRSAWPSKPFMPLRGRVTTSLTAGSTRSRPPRVWRTIGRRWIGVTPKIPPISTRRSCRAMAVAINAIAACVAAKVDAVISVSELTTAQFLAWARLPRDRVFLLPNAVARQHYRVGRKNPDLLQRYGLAGKSVLLTLSRLCAAHNYKGIDEVLGVMPALAAELPEIADLIVGDGDDRERLQAKARSLGWPTGWFLPALFPKRRSWTITTWRMLTSCPVGVRASASSI